MALIKKIITEGRRLNIGEEVPLPNHGIGIVVGEEWVNNVQTAFISVPDHITPAI
ncbi:MAG: hypothetical protein NTU61_06535 [Candidatus Altiarchaeota archaeon]|nr:hypothetical protein [Candidatus Altiarchaeota archaeon]